MERADRLILTLSYTLYGKIGRVLTAYDVRTESEDFGADVKITLYIRENDRESFTAELIDLCNGSINVEKTDNIEYNFG